MTKWPTTLAKAKKHYMALQTVMTVTKETSLSCNEFQERLSIFERAESHKWSVKYTYLRNYFAAKWVGWIGWALDIFTAIVGAILIYMLTREGNPDFPFFTQLSTLQPADLAIVILFGSLVSSFYGPKLRSRKYYNAGQEHQELYDEIVDFLEMDVSNPNKKVNDLRAKLDRLNKRRHELNQSTPQLGGIWYHSMKAWGWTTGKAVMIYSLVAPWKKTPETLYKTLHPRKEREENDEEDKKNTSAARLKAKMMQGEGE